MRMTQPMGLAPKAQAFLKERAVLENHCEHCGRDDGYVRKEISRTGMSDDLALYEYMLYEYMLKDGCVAKEFVQVTIWSSGPMIWVGLDVDGEKFLWPESEIQE